MTIRKAKRNNIAKAVKRAEKEQPQFKCMDEDCGHVFHSPCFRFSHELGRTSDDPSDYTRGFYTVCPMCASDAKFVS